MVNIKAPRPEGTDGSDNSFRMIIEDRYKRMALLRKVNGWLMMINVVLMLLISAWNAVPLLEGGSYPIMSIVLLTLEMASVLMYLLAEPGTGRENIKYIKAYGFMAFLVASEHILTRFWYHVHLPKEVLYPKVVVAYLNNKHDYSDTDTLLMAMETWEAALDGSLSLSLLAAAFVCNAYITEKRTPATGATSTPADTNESGADSKKRN